uniref:DDB1- and CUL4-associated factor 11 n=1 Tax=Romanomermis culicivorax TaxID=13658 RepID=A0A915L2V2_ROMCU
FLPNKSSRLEKCVSKVFVSQFEKNGDLLVVGSQDQRIKIFDTSQYKYQFINEIAARDVGWIRMVNTWCIPAGLKKVVHQCKLNGDSESHVEFDMLASERRFCCFSLRFSPDFQGTHILAGANDCCVYVYDRAINRRILRVLAHSDDVNSVCFAGKTTDIFYTGSDDGLIKVWDRRLLDQERPKPVACFAGHSDGVTYIDSKGDAQYLISNSKDQSIKLWDLRRPSTSSGIHAANQIVAKQSWDYRYETVARLRRPCRIPGDSSVATYSGAHRILHTLIRCFFSPLFTTGQSMIYTGCATGACVVYDVNSGERVAKLDGHRACVRDVSWHPYHNEICTSSYLGNRDVQWDAEVLRWQYRTSSEDRSQDEESDYDSACTSSDEMEIRIPTITLQFQ